MSIRRAIHLCLTLAVGYLALVQNADAYGLEGVKWPVGTQIALNGVTEFVRSF